MAAIMKVMIVEAPGAEPLGRIVRFQIENGWHPSGSPFFTGLYLPKEGQSKESGIPTPASHVPVLGWGLMKSDDTDPAEPS